MLVPMIRLGAAHRWKPATAIAMAAVLVGALGAADSAAAKATKHPLASPSFYALKNKKQRCRVHYTRQTVTIGVRKRHRTVTTHQVRCVYTGSGAGGNAVRFPTNLPTAAVAVTVIPGADDASFAIPSGEALDVGGIGLLAANDGSDLTVLLVSGTAHGALTLKRDGTFRYVPASSFSGLDSFSYRTVNSSGESSTPAKVTIHVTPVAAAVGTYAVPVAGTLSVGTPGVLAGDTGSGLKARLVSGPSGGSLTLNGDGSFTYTAAPSFSGFDSFTFEAVDSSGQDSGAVTVTIDVGA